MIRFTGVDVEKLRKYYFSPDTKLKVLKAVTEYQAVDEGKLREWWSEHNQAVEDITALSCLLFSK